MTKHTMKIFSFIGMVLCIGSCTSSKTVTNTMRAEEWQPQIDLPASVVVCREKQCAPAKLSMSKEYIYNSLTHLLENNNGEKAQICQADPMTHVCTEDYLTLPITVGVTPAHMYIQDVEISDVSLALNRKSLDLLLNYGVSYNAQVPTCKPSKSLIYVKNTQNIILEDSGYTCKMTTIGNTTIKTLFAIDYIDLDYGFIGGYYSIGLSGPAYGGRSGYMLFKLPNDAYPLSPDLILPEKSITNGQNNQTSNPNNQMIATCNTKDCPRPVLEQYTVLCEESDDICRANGVSGPVPVKNIFSQKAVNSKNLPAKSKDTTTMSVYEKGVSKDPAKDKYKGVEIFPIYQKKKK